MLENRVFHKFISQIVNVKCFLFVFLVFKFVEFQNFFGLFELNKPIFLPGFGVQQMCVFGRFFDLISVTLYRHLANP